MKIRAKKFKKIAAGIIPVLALTLSSAFTPAINGRVYAEEDGPVGGNYYLSDYDTRAEAVKAGNDVAKEIVAEGTVLLKNEDNALPLIDDTSISLFGKGMYQQMSGLVSSLGSAGFSINGRLASFYNNSTLSGTGHPGHPDNGAVLSGYPTGETPISKFTPEVKTSIETEANKKNGVAIVGFYRTAGEGHDLPRTMGKYSDDYAHYSDGEMEVAEGARAIDDHILQLNKDESELLKYVGENYSKVIVILNSSNPMECGFLDDPDHYAYHKNIKGALWLNTYTAWPMVADILRGDINPSGRLSDTYARDYKADPTWNNFGNNFMENYGSTYAKGNQYTNLPSTSGLGGGGYANNYVYYKEGIYVAYRYWETRGYTEGINTKWVGEETDTLSRFAHGPNEAIHYYSKTNATDKAKQDVLDGKEWNNWYDAHVVFPFGHGLSYTNFTWSLDSITETPDFDGNITATVTVKNTGSYAGKDVVQLYYSAPYIKGGIEKSHVKLGAFAKTKLLDPGKSDTVTLTFKVRDMASYDYNDANKNGFKGYELDAGTYNIFIGKNAHCWAYEDALTHSYSLTAHKYLTDDASGNEVKNRFDHVSEQLSHEDRYPEDKNNDEKDLYMSRADWTGTYPTLSYRLTAEQWIVDGLKQYKANFFPQDKVTDPWYVPESDMPTTGAKYEQNIMLNELHGLKYDDPTWDKFLDQLSYDQIYSLALRGAYASGVNYPEFGITKERNHDGPNNLALESNAERIWLPPDIMTASTWNEELGYRRGKAMADMSLWGEKDVSSRIVGWYAPAVNIHRNQFGGRVNEYFSEDGVLAGKIASAIVRGSQEKGMYCYVKHFALNAQEVNRCGVLTWANEQSMREVHFTPFEIIVKEGKTLGMMSSLNRIGYEWAGGDYHLLTEVLRDEWGFRGAVVTDSFMQGEHSNADVMIRAGGSLTLGSGEITVSKNSATVVTALRNGTHDVLYALANSMAINRGDTPTIPKRIRRFETKTLEVGMVNQAYSQSLADCVELNTEVYPTLDVGKIKFMLADNSVLPNGLSLSEDGVISGKPKVAAQQSITINAVYDNEKLAATFAINIVDEGGAILFKGETNLKASIDEAFTARVDNAYIYDPTTEDVKDVTIAYALDNGSVLPEGLTMTTEGVISGMPTKECEGYTFTVVASAMGYPDGKCVFTIDVLFPLVFQAKQLKTGEFGASYADSVFKAVCEANVTYALKSGSELPQGLFLTSGGLIGGVPTVAVANHKFIVVASADCAEAVEAEYSITVNPAFDAMMKLPNGEVGEDYFASVDTAQGAAGLVYSIVEGSLPKGLTLGEDGILSGTPTEGGTFDIVIEARSGDAATTAMLTLYIAGGSNNTAPADYTVIIVVSVLLGVAVLALGGTFLFLKLFKSGKGKAEAAGQSKDTAAESAGENNEADNGEVNETQGDDDGSAE